jgi:thiol:disulfide interchange protein DsbC
MKTAINILFASIVCLVSCNALADDAMLAKLREHYPNTTFTGVNRSEIKGVYEVIMGKNIAYTDDTGRYMVFGHMFDMTTQADLTAARQEQLNRVEWPAAYLQLAIREVKGNGLRKLVVFTDPDCTYCKHLESELAKLNNVTIYTFLYPIDSLHPAARQKAVSIWCGTDKVRVWKEWMLANKEPKLGTCPNPVNDIIALAQKYHVHGTPTMISADGRVLAGTTSAARIDQWLEVKS